MFEEIITENSSTFGENYKSTDPRSSSSHKAAFWCFETVPLITRNIAIKM